MHEIVECIRKEARYIFPENAEWRRREGENQNESRITEILTPWYGKGRGGWRTVRFSASPSAPRFRELTKLPFTTVGHSPRPDLPRGYIL